MNPLFNVITLVPKKAAPQPPWYKHLDLKPYALLKMTKPLTLSHTGYFRLPMLITSTGVLHSTLSLAVPISFFSPPNLPPML